MSNALKFGFTVVILMTLSSVLSANHGPIFNDDVAHVTAIVGRTAWLPCNAQHRGGHKIIWMNPKKIVFANDEKIVIVDKRIRVEWTEHGDWNLRIDHVRFNDSGQYQCVINTTPVKMKNVYLNVYVPPHILHEESSRDMDVEEGSSVQLKCKATGYPSPNITWYKRTESPMHIQENLQVQGETLNITNIQRYQKGMYICHADNGVSPSKSRQMMIRVQYAPVVKLLNKRLGQTPSKATVLVCSVTSYPRAKITWFRNGYAIQHSYKYRLEIYSGEPDEPDEYTLSMEMPNIDKNDYGDYTCHAQNRMGNESATMILYEYREPTEPHTTPHTTTQDHYIYDERYSSTDDTSEEDYFPANRRKYDPGKYHSGNFRSDQNTHGANKPYHQPTASGCRSDLHFPPSFLLLCVTVFFLAEQL